ncbi:MAG TPA: hypothetical protein VMC81_06495 [Rhodocyclaceae bacterium]|nr:hypothetical protein [Rhodocyclaceae bacterium]
MISSLPIFVITATELAARPVANRPAMPIDCRNTDAKAGQRLNLPCFSRLVPNPQVFLIKTALRISCAAVVRAVSPARRGNFPHSAKTTRGFVQSGFYEVAHECCSALARARPHRTLKIPRGGDF